MKKKMVCSLFFAMFFLFFTAQVYAVVPPWEIEALAGKPAPNFKATDVDGQAISLETLHGQVVLLNFWATWCRPCIDEMPSLQSLSQHFKGKGLVVVGISVDKNPAIVQSFLKRLSLSFPVVIDAESTIADAYKVFTYPSTFLLDQQGRVQGYYIGEQDWQAKTFVDKVEKMIEGTATSEGRRAHE